MNPSQPTTADIRHIEGVFTEQMRLLTRAACRNPVRSFDMHCTDRRAVFV